MKIKVYKSPEPSSFPFYVFIYRRNSNKSIDGIRIKSGPLSKFGFYSWETIEILEEEYFGQEYKGQIPKEVKKELIEAIFWYKKF